MKQQDKYQKRGKEEEPGKAESQGKSMPKENYDLANVSYFGYTEKPFFERMSRWRIGFFHPVLLIFRSLGVRPNHLTGTAFFSLLIAFPLLFWLKLPQWAFVVLAANIILDGLDGPLAKLEGGHSSSGAFWDMANDLTTMVVVVITAAHFQFMNPTVAFVYVACYLYLSFFGIALNVLRIPYRFVTKSKYPVYIFLLIRQMTGLDLTTWFCLLMISIMVIHIIISARRMAMSLDNED